MTLDPVLVLSAWFYDRHMGECSGPCGYDQESARAEARELLDLLSMTGLALVPAAEAGAVERIRAYCQDALGIFLREGIDSPPAVGVADVLEMLGDA